MVYPAGSVLRLANNFRTGLCHNDSTLLLYMKAAEFGKRAAGWNRPVVQGLPRSGRKNKGLDARLDQAWNPSSIACCHGISGRVTQSLWAFLFLKSERMTWHERASGRARHGLCFEGDRSGATAPRATPWLHHSRCANLGMVLTSLCLWLSPGHGETPHRVTGGLAAKVIFSIVSATQLMVWLVHLNRTVDVHFLCFSPSQWHPS